MKQEKNQPMNGEETVVEANATDRKEEKKDKKKMAWKQVMLGGVGVLIGATPSLFSNEISAQEIEESLPDANGETAGSEYHLDSVTDEMSFNEAFAAARAELGAGGVFEWRGNLYGTYTADEWRELHPEENAAAETDDTADAAQTEHPANEDPAAPGQDAPTDEAPAESEEPQSGEDSTAGEVAIEEPAETEDDEVVILGVSNVELEDGSEVVVGGMTIGGNEVMVIDVDNDGVFDGMIADMNGDGVIDESEIINIQDSNLTVEQFTEMAEPESAFDLADDGGYSNEIG